MALGLGSMLYVVLLLINAVAVLNEERFLARVGLTSQSHLSQQQYAFQDPAYGATSESVKTRLINLIGAVRTLMRIPLIAINIAVIGYELVLG